ncbi:MAG: formimidoylglutamase [Flavobacteriaceae bacterium]
MDFSLLTPVSDRLFESIKLSHFQSLGRKLKLHTSQTLPDLEDVNIAIFGVLETRNATDDIGETFQLDEVRKSLYSLFPGNWSVNIVDLGDLKNGASVNDTYFAVSQLIKSLLEQKIIPIIIGGSQDLTYANYRAYDTIRPMINIVNIDKSFDLGDSSKPITNSSYIGKVILEKPYNLFNYTTLGYQTYFNAQEEIDLMEKLYFEYYRLGNINKNIKTVEPALRDADLVTVDLKSVKSSEVSIKQKYSPNGFDGKEICAISRYAGISNRVSSFGIYEYNPSPDDEATSMLIAQMIWYFIEGYCCRQKDDQFQNTDDFNKYTVLVESQELVFYKSLKTGRWWIETPFLTFTDTKQKKYSLLACMQEDYEQATKGIIPERWYKACKKN